METGIRSRLQQKKGHKYAGCSSYWKKGTAIIPLFDPVPRFPFPLFLSFTVFLNTGSLQERAQKIVETFRLMTAT